MSSRINLASRRSFIAGTAAAGTSLLLGGRSNIAAAAPTSAPLRFAHMTDMHIQPERKGGEGYAAALASLEKLQPKPSFLITGGDHVMDVFDQGPARSKMLWDLYDKTLSQNTKLRAYPTIGNHDVWAWGEKQKEIAPNSPGYGKAMALDRLKVNNPFHSFDQGDWHFINLDNISRRDFGYFGGFDDEQAEWLKADLAANKSRPICVTTHIPLLCACAFFDGKRFENEKHAYNVPDSYMHAQVWPLLTLLRDNNVKLCLCGHIHLIDAIDFAGIKFLCNGAVSGNWWKGGDPKYIEGYGVIDLWPDGRIEHQYVTYGWVAAPEEPVPARTSIRSIEAVAALA